MSEFKYACPVCGQHISCDSSQSGTVMECPTCFQKITVPQAPSDAGQKFILTGSKVTDRKIPLLADTGGAIVGKPKAPLATGLLVFVLLAAAGAGVYFFLVKPPAVGPSGAGTSSVSSWSALNVGDVDVGGSMTRTKAAVTLSGSGADIWHKSDAFYFVFKSVEGNGSLAAQVLGVQNTDEWAKGGVMIRATTNADSMFALASVRADGQAQLIWRSAKGAEAQASDLAGGPGYPKWVKIVRKGSLFSAYYNLDGGDTWLPLGEPQNIKMPHETQIGLAVCSHQAGALCAAQFSMVDLMTETKIGPRPGSGQVEEPAAPPASDTNWMLNLDGVTNISQAPVAGRIHGRNFLCHHATLQGGTLSLRGADGLGVAISFHGAPTESLAGQTINVSTNADKAARVTLYWKDGDQSQREKCDSGYALRLEFGPLAGNRISGKIHLCLPDNLKSYALGTFVAEIRQPKARRR